MRVKVERCWNGSSYSFRLTLPDGRRESIDNPSGDWWRRSDAVKAKDKLCNLYGLKRDSIRFHHSN